jgi:predicted site-specific integrase-resolvase
MMLSSPADRKKLYDAVQELSNSMTRVDAERDFQKEAIKDVAESLNLDKKYVRKIARIFHKNNLNEVKQEHEDVETLYFEMTSTNPVV